MILGTAGHVDHGKTALVRALTGIDTDRLPEEKRRGITIELGFAPLVLDGVGTIGVVDVPGHEAFVRTMLAGASGVDLALLVIAADEGVMPQTREHVAILTLLGVAGGVVALTKSDLVEEDWLQLVEADVRALLAGTPLEAAPIVPCSVISGVGIAEVRSAIAAAAAAVPARDAADLPRMPIDRAFSVKGTGAVVTGTLWTGMLADDAAVRLMPSDRTARVRSLESHGARVSRAAPGSRVAAALGGIDHADVARGDVLVGADDPWAASTALRADVALVDGAAPLGVRTRVRFHLGTVEVGARVVAATGRVTAGDATRIFPVRIVLDEPVVARAGDRFVLRSSSPALTIGGGIVTDPRPPARRAKPWPTAGASAATRLGWIAEESGRGGFPVHDMPTRIGGPPLAADAPTPSGVVRIADRLYSAGVRSSLSASLLTAVKAHHAANTLSPGLSLQQARERLKANDELFTDVLDELCATSVLKVQGGVIAVSKWQAGSTDADTPELDALFRVLHAAGPEPPSVSELGARFGNRTPALLRTLERQGRVVAVAQDRFFEAGALGALVDKLRQAGGNGAPRTASQLKEILGLTRKYVIPLLEYADRVGITIRKGDTRTVRPPG